MVSSEYLDKHFYDKYYTLGSDVIIKLNQIRNQGGLNNVVVGRQPHCYGLELIDDSTTIDYQIYYINGTSDLSGVLLKLSIEDPESDRLLIVFSMHIADTYHLDALETFNTFQEQIQTMCEQLGYYTITSNQLAQYNNPTLIVKDHKGIIIAPFLFHADLFQFIFGPLSSTIEEGKSYVYIMFNKTNKFIKIGKSIRPGHRERTLQAEEPKILMLAFWEAIPQVERELHKIYKQKKVRGEWFDLSYKDLINIKQFMDKQSQI